MASSEDKGVISYTDVFAKDKTAKSRRKRRQDARVHVTCHFAVSTGLLFESYMWVGFLPHPSNEFV
jgi:hypothetical protein